MGGGNGAKSAKARADAQKNAPKAASSQLKSNAAALTHKCKVCMQSFQSTTKKPELTTHAMDRHKKTVEDCFPDSKLD